MVTCFCHRYRVFSRPSGTRCITNHIENFRIPFSNNRNIWVKVGHGYLLIGQVEDKFIDTSFGYFPLIILAAFHHSVFRNALMVKGYACFGSLKIVRPGWNVGLIKGNFELAFFQNAFISELKWVVRCLLELLHQRRVIVPSPWRCITNKREPC